jgi:tetratricopeptide (TPR) repeat protein/tRNA A-37 threonylcarbamoyl transferase component Bud32
MSDKGGATEARIARARSGDRDELDRLLERFRSDMLALAQREAGRAGDQPGPAQLAQQTLDEAARQFSLFPGATEEELRQWLEAILVRCASVDEQWEPTTLPAAGPEDAAVGPPAKGRSQTTLGPGLPTPPQPPPLGAGLPTPPQPTPPQPPTEGLPERSGTGSEPQALEQPAESADFATLDTTKGTGREVHELETLAAEHAPAGGRAVPAGSRSFGDYELLDIIAKGGMGVVYKARQKKLNRIVALKMILAGQFANERDVERFYGEAEAAANLRHPNIVAVHEVGEAEGQHFFSMDFVDGQSLSAMVRERPLSPQWAAQLVQKIAEAVEFAHGQGILHRDLKPSNVLLDKRGQPLITDFGLAKRVGGHSHLTMTGTVVGTPSYMPPEQAAGKSEEVGPESDVYSTGALLYELLTGTPPFRAATPLETLQQVLHNEAPSPRLLNSSVPADLETICLKCLQKEPARRYQTSQQLADELGRYLAGEPILARPVSRLERLARWCRRNPRIAGLSGALAAAVVLAAGVFVVSYLRTSAALEKAQQRLNQALRSVDELFTIVSQEDLLNEPGMQPLRKRLLSKARDLYREMLAQEADDPAVRGELALSYFRLGSILEEIGSPADALAAYESSRQMQERLSAEMPNDRDLLSGLANTWSALATLLHKRKEYEKALQWHERALDARTQLAKWSPGRVDHARKRANSSMNIGLVHKDRGDLQNARLFLRQAQTQRLEILQHHSGVGAEASEIEQVRRDLAKGYYNLGNLGWNARQLQADTLPRTNQKAADQNLQDAVEGFRQAV